MAILNLTSVSLPCHSGRRLPRRLSMFVALNGGTLLLTRGTIGFDFGAGEVPCRLDLTLMH